jgi:DNA-3-methyladenine glycosylase II
MPWKAHLSKDKKLKPLVERIDMPPLKKGRNPFIYLAGSVMSQQLNTKVADIIYGRFLGLYGGKIPAPEQVLNTRIDVLRTAGLSGQKAAYIQNIAQFAVAEDMSARYLNKLSDEEVIAYLSAIKGVGRWTVEMLMISCLGREDVFSAGDYGLQSAIAQLYKLDNGNKKAFHENMLQLSAKWAPYRSYACRYLWRWKDAE